MFCFILAFEIPLLPVPSFEQFAPSTFNGAYSFMLHVTSSFTIMFTYLQKQIVYLVAVLYNFFTLLISFLLFSFARTVVSILLSNIFVILYFGFFFSAWSGHSRYFPSYILAAFTSTFSISDLMSWSKFTCGSMGIHFFFLVTFFSCHFLCFKEIALSNGTGLMKCIFSF